MPQLTILASTKGGEVGFFNIGQLKDFAKNNPNKSLIVTFKVEDSGSKSKMIAYFYAKVLKEWQQALLTKGIVWSEKKISNYLLGLSDLTKNRRLSELSADELTIFLDLIKDVSLQEVNLFIEDPRIL